MARSVCSKLVTLTVGLLLLPNAFADDVVQDAPEAGPALAWRKNRLGGEFYNALGSGRAEKKQGVGFGVSFLLPLTDSGFDLGFRYATITQAVNSYNILTFVFDYFVLPSYVRGLYVGGEVGVTESNAEDIFSIFNDYVFAAKAGFEYWIKGTHWSAAFEYRRISRTEDPIKMDRESHHYANQLLFSARYSL